MLLASPNRNLSHSYPSTSSVTNDVSKGVLHLKWNSGVPFFVFSVDDQLELYVANPYIEESLDENSVNYMYSFCSRTDSQTEQGCSGDNVSDIIAKMKVLSSLTLDSTNLKLAETKL